MGNLSALGAAPNEIGSVPARHVDSPPASPSKSKPKPKPANVKETYESTLRYSLVYLCIESAIVVAGSVLFRHVGPPPWRLDTDASWHQILASVSVWMNIGYGLSHLVNGVFYRDFRDTKFKIAWLICWAVNCLAQVLVTTLLHSFVPVVAKLCVIGIANLAAVAVHLWPSIDGGHSVVLKVLRLHVEDKLLWAAHGALLMSFSHAGKDIPVGAELLNLLASQVFFQFLAWLDVQHCAPFHNWGLYQQSNHASHILSVHMAWKAQTMGSGHATVWLYFFFALSSTLYVPRATLPNFAADKTMRIWSKLVQPALSPLFSTVPLLAAMYHTVVAAHDAVSGTGDAAGWFGLHFVASQALLFFIRILRFQYETDGVTLVPRATGWALALDAGIFGALKLVMISSLQLP